MTVSSKFGLKVGAHDIFELKSPDDALELVRTVVNQFLGDSFTTYQPRCPICDTHLCDHEKYMNKPVGECTNKKCGSTVHAADFFGKIMDVLSEWEHCRPDYEAKLKSLIENQKEAEKKDDDDDDYDAYSTYDVTGTKVSGFKPKDKATVGYISDKDFVKEINGEPVFVW